MPGSYLLGAPFGEMWVCTVVPSTCAVITVVWLVWGAETCGVRLLRSLAFRCTVFVPCNPTIVLFRSIVPLSSIGLPRVFTGLLI